MSGARPEDMSGDGTSERTGAGTLGPTSPSWMLRGALALACVVTGSATVLWVDAHLFYVTLLAGTALLATTRPDSHAPAGFLGLAMFVVLVYDAGLSGWIIPAVLGLHATHSLAGVAAVVPWDAAVERAALRPAARRLLAVQAASQALVLLALLVSP